MKTCPCCGAIVSDPIEQEADMQRWLKARISTARLMRDVHRELHVDGLICETID